MDKKILIIVNSLDFFLTHRNTLAQKLAENGCNVEVITDMQGKEYTDKHIKFHNFEIDRSSINPFSFFIKVIRLKKHLSINKYDVYYFVSHKSNILGGIATLFDLRKKIIFSISGLGYAFISNNFLAKLVKTLILFSYSILAKKSNSIFIFQNNDDKKLFLNYKILQDRQSIIIPGMGVDLQKFNFKERVFFQADKPIRVLFAGRLLIDKGIKEFLELASKFKDRNFEFHISGKLDSDNPNAINPKDFNDCLSESNLIYHGHINFDKMFELYRATDIFLLPSYREGFPKAAMEAAAMGQPLLMSNVPGCRDCIIDGLNGFLFKNGDIEEMELQLLKISDKNKLEYFSKNSRKHVEENFSATYIANQYIDVILAS
jgi:glycosyltransferase involved in cell wall biosynthesis